MTTNTTYISLNIYSTKEVHDNTIISENLDSIDVDIITDKFRSWIRYPTPDTFDITSEISNTSVVITVYRNNIDNSCLNTIKLSCLFNDQHAVYTYTLNDYISTGDVDNISDVISLLAKINNGAIDITRCKSIHELIGAHMERSGFEPMVATKLRQNT